MLGGMRTIAYVLALAFVLVAGGGCNEEDAAKEGTTTIRETGTPTPGDPNLITKSGTVRWLDLEGGFWGIVADDSSRYDPGVLDERFRKDGLRVRFDARKAENQMSIRQWGTLVTIVRIDPL
jgi:hypothetical protein